MTVMSEGLLLNSKFEPKPNLSKTLKGLLMRLAIFDNTFFQLNSLTTCAGQRCRNRKERSRPSLLVCFLFHLAKYIIILEHLVPFCQCPVWVLKRAQEVCVDLHDHGNHNRPPDKSCSSTHSRQQTIQISTNFVLTSLVGRGYPNHFDSGDRNLQLGGGKQGAVIQLEFQPSPRVANFTCDSGDGYNSG